MLKEKQNTPSPPLTHTKVCLAKVWKKHPKSLPLGRGGEGRGNMRKGWYEESVHLLLHKSPYCLSFFTMESIYYL